MVACTAPPEPMLLREMPVVIQLVGLPALVALKEQLVTLRTSPARAPPLRAAVELTNEQREMLPQRRT